MVLLLRPADRATSSHARDAAMSRGTACASRVRPDSVSSTLRVVRVNSSTPSDVSSWRICELSVCWLMCWRWAARVKCSSSATATNDPRFRRSG